jgi:hypothetical protein
VSWKGQRKPLYLPPSRIEHPYEAECVEHGMKWSPVKTSGTNMPKGRGASTNWRLVVSYLSRTPTMTRCRMRAKVDMDVLVRAPSIRAGSDAQTLCSVRRR